MKIKEQVGSLEPQRKIPVSEIIEYDAGSNRSKKHLKGTSELSKLTKNAIKKKDATLKKPTSIYSNNCSNDEDNFGLTSKRSK